MGGFMPYLPEPVELCQHARRFSRNGRECWIVLDGREPRIARERRRRPPADLERGRELFEAASQRAAVRSERLARRAGAIVHGRGEYQRALADLVHYAQYGAQWLIAGTPARRLGQRASDRVPSVCAGAAGGEPSRAQGPSVITRVRVEDRVQPSALSGDLDGQGLEHLRPLARGPQREGAERDRGADRGVDDTVEERADRRAAAELNHERDQHSEYDREQRVVGGEGCVCGEAQKREQRHDRPAAGRKRRDDHPRNRDPDHRPRCASDPAGDRGPSRA